jgi:hypothetical protein
MSSKQLGAILNRVPPATARPRSQPAPATTSVIAPVPSQRRGAPLGNAKEVPLQVLVPEHIREQLGVMAARERTSLRALVLRAVRSLDIEVSDEEIKDKRGRRS